MSATTQLFTAPSGTQLRTVTLDGSVYFLAKDAAVALGYTNPQKAIRDHVDEEDRTVNELFTINGTAPTLINESGLYTLILSSKLDTAKTFKRWVTAEVLPAIRRTGGYMVDRPEETPEETMARALQIAAATIERKASRIAELEAQAQQSALELADARPKALFADAVSASDSCILIGELAKLIRQNGIPMGQNRLFDWMRKNKYLNAMNRPSQRSMERGYFKLIERTVVCPDGSSRVCFTTKVTGKGQQYFINLFLNQANA